MAHPFNQELNTALAVFAKPVRKCFLQNRKSRIKLDVRAHLLFSILLILQTCRKFLAVRVCQVAATAQERQHQHVVAASKLQLRWLWFYKTYIITIIVFAWQIKASPHQQYSWSWTSGELPDVQNPGRLPCQARFAGGKKVNFIWFWFWFIWFFASREHRLLKSQRLPLFHCQYVKI